MHIWNGMVKGFSKMYNFSFFGQFFFLQTFLLYNWILQIKHSFCKFANFFANSKSRAQELSNDVSFVIFRHQTWDLEVLVFKYLSTNRVNWIISFQCYTGNFNRIKKSKLTSKFHLLWLTQYMYELFLFLDFLDFYFKDTNLTTTDKPLRMTCNSLRIWRSEGITLGFVN